MTSIPAAADVVESVSIEPPATYAELPGLSDKVGNVFPGAALVDDADVGAKAWARAGRGALYVIGYHATSSADDPTGAARLAFDRLRARRVAASPEGSTSETAYAERSGDRVWIAEHEWRHLEEPGL